MSETIYGTNKARLNIYGYTLGVASGAVSVASHLNADNTAPVQLELKAAAAAGTCRGIFSKVVTGVQTSGTVIPIRGEAFASAAISGGYVYGVQGKATLNGQAFSGTVLAGVYGQLDVTGGTVSAGHVAPIQSNIYGANSGAYGSIVGLYIEHAGGGVIDSLIEVFGKSDYVFRIASNTHTNVSTTGTAGATTSKGWLKVIVDGAVRYIPLTDSVS